MTWLLLGALAATPARPVEAPVPGQCDAPVALVPGKPLPEGLIGPDGLVTCGGTVLPSGTARHFYDLKTWADYELVPALERAELTLGWERTVHQEQLAALKPRKMDAPAVQRTLGRVETLVAIAVVTGIVVYADNQRR